MNRIRDSESLPDEAKSATQSGSAKTAWVKSKIDVLTAFVARWFTPSHPTEPKTREQIESELAIPALALTVIGVGGLLLRLLMVLLNPWSLGSFYYFTFEFWMGMTFAAGAIATFTGMSLKSLQNFRSVVVGCVWVLALFGILWPATLPFAIWALVILRHPSAKTHFTDVPLSECRAWITPRDLAIRWWSRGCEWFQFVWPKIRVANSKVVEFPPRGFQKFVTFIRSKIVIRSVIFLSQAYLLTLWSLCIQIAMVLAGGSIRPGIVRDFGGFKLSDFDPAPVAPALATTGFCMILGTIVLWRHSVRVFRSSGSLSRADRLAAPREALLGMAGTSFLIAVFMTIVMTIVSGRYDMPSRSPGPMKWGLEHWDWRFLLLIVQLGFDLLIGLSLALMCWTSRTRLTRWALFFSTIAYPLLLGTSLLERASLGYWAALVPIWSCVPFGLWAMIVLRRDVKQNKPIPTLAQEGTATAVST